ncbi:DASH family cryptochrome [Maribacter chungangensis]|uniref:Cryptochrome DASH n=1 Tax=Maribacter chungangensis TaxID=1069117 RepID=A0ABW3B4M4_9FLAO
MKNLMWFRNDLRVADNPVLKSACTGEKVIAVYCFDPRHYQIDSFGFKKTEKYRAKFLIETITELRASLRELNISLLVYHKKPEDIIPQIVKDYGIQNIYSQKEWTKEENAVLDAVIAKVPALVNFEEYFGQFLFHPDDIPFNSVQDIPQVFTAFRKKCEKYSKVRPLIPVPNAMDRSNLLEGDTQIPSLKELGLSDFEMDTRTAFPFKGGESSAMERIQHYFWETKKLAYYKKTRNGLIGIDYSSKLSAWLANGSISATTIYWEVQRFEKEEVKNQDTYWLVFELIWRDFFKYISLKHGNAFFLQGGILDKNYDWEYSESKMKKWITGATQEPFVNANMKELAATGWMSNRGRQNVASFWSKEWQQDWRYGAAYFESILIDYDVHSNWGNWMYNSGVGNDPRDRKFNIARQADMYDAQGKFQRLWLQDTLF